MEDRAWDPRSDLAKERRSRSCQVVCCCLASIPQSMFTIAPTQQRAHIGVHCQWGTHLLSTFWQSILPNITNIAQMWISPGSSSSWAFVSDLLLCRSVYSSQSASGSWGYSISSRWCTHDVSGPYIRGRTFTSGGGNNTYRKTCRDTCRGKGTCRGGRHYKNEYGRYEEN